MAILSFADDIRFESRWGTSEQEMRAAFENLQTRGNETRLYDAVAQALDEFGAEAGRTADFPSRRCIVVLSDGHDEGSHITLNQLVTRLEGSRVRLDAIGLAHSPLWLESLQSLSHAGFGAFRKASTPEALTQLLEQGIDALLDTPVLEFDSATGPRDGASRQVGVEEVATGRRDQMAAKIPDALLWKRPAVWAAAAGIVLIVVCAPLLLWKRRPAAAPAPAVSPAWQTDRRGGTVAETVSRPPRAPAPSRAATEVEPRPAAAAPPPAPRPATQLAPQRAAAAATLVCVAGPFTGQRFPLDQPEFWIGSAGNNHLPLASDGAVSGNHACIRRDQGFLRLYDNQSLNDTWVNGRAIGQEVVVLRPGDRIRVGQSEFTLMA